MFKSGDKVICTSKNTNNLIRAKTYTVSDVFYDEDKITLVGISYLYKYDCDKFIKKYENRFNVGDKIVLIDDSGNIALKKGEVYTVSKHHSFLDTYDELNLNIFLYETTGEFDCDRFISLKEYRKQKIQNLCLK